eukprot:SAG31_NODE_35180_length_325_cov_1.137168_1_plen_22_part_10
MRAQMLAAAVASLSLVAAVPRN